MSLRKRILFLVLILVLAWQEPARAENIVVKMNHLRVSLTGENRLQVEETYALDNPGTDQSGGEGLHFFLPAGYLNLEYETGIDLGQVSLEGDELVLKQQVPPGSSTYGLSYQLELTGDSGHYIINKKFHYPTGQFFVMSEKDELRIISQDLADQGIVAMGDTHFRIYTASDLPRGSTMPIVVIPSLEGTTDTTPVPGTQGPPADYPDQDHMGSWGQSPFLGFLILALLAIPLGAFFWYRTKKSQEMEASSPVEAREELLQRLKVEEDVLKRKILELEEQLAAGSISPEDHEMLQGFYKKKLVEVRVQLRSFPE